MARLIDQIVTYDGSNTGDNTVPPGLDVQTYGTSWCHLVSDSSLEDLQEFLTENFATIGAPVENIRRPIDGSNVTYIGLNTDQRDQAIIAGAAPNRRQTVLVRAFDHGQSSGATTYEP